MRTYITHRIEPGIYFMTEWMPNRLSMLIGPRTYGLPYQYGRLDYNHHQERGMIQGIVTPGCGRGRLHHRATLRPSAGVTAAEVGSVSGFLLERDTAYALAGNRRRLFRIWHDPWPQSEVNIELIDDSALGWTGPWFHEAELTGARYSPGVEGVRIGRPRGIGGSHQRGWDRGRDGRKPHPAWRRDDSTGRLR